MSVSDSTKVSIEAYDEDNIKLTLKQADGWQQLSTNSESLPGYFERLAADDAVPSYFEVNAGRVACFSSRRPGRKSPNEDGLGIVPTLDGVVLVVADGMGGQAAGELAARLTIETICKAIAAGAAEAIDGENRLRPAILDGIELANKAVLNLGLGAGATVAIASIEGLSVRSYHVGDSAFVLMGQRGKVKHATVAHSPVGYAEAAGLLNPEEAMHHEDRHYVLNHVGADEMRIEIGPTLPLGRRDTLLLATDGLTDNLLLEEMVDLLRIGPLDASAASLALAAHQRMNHPQEGSPSKLDDLTFVAYRSQPLPIEGPKTS